MMKICWIIGSVLLILVVVSLGLLAPWFNSRISRLQDELSALEYDREMRFMNLQKFLMLDLREGQLVTDLHVQRILKDVSAARSIEARREKQVEESLWALHSALIGQMASPELKDKWADMNTPQLHREIKGIVKNEDFTNLYKDIKEKKVAVEKAEGTLTSVIVFTSIFQVVGLLLISVSQYVKEYVTVKPNKGMKPGS
jgi:hypothetical protein